MTGWLPSPSWAGQTAVCIGSGPSLTVEDVDFVRGKARVIAINRNIELAPWADIGYCADAKMWVWLNGAPAFTGQRVGIERRWGRHDVARDFGVALMRQGVPSGLSTRPDTLCTGGNSGHQAVNLAFLMGATRIVLLGYDMQAGERGQQEWHAPHPQPGRPNFETWRERLQGMVAELATRGVSVVNCSRRTALTVPRMELDVALREAVAA